MLVGGVAKKICLLSSRPRPKAAWRNLPANSSGPGPRWGRS